MTRWYVTMTWDDWPKCGSYGTIVEAENHQQAEEKCKLEMARHRATNESERTDDALTCEEVLGTWAGDWHTVDCFDLDEFINRHKRKARA